MQAKLIKTNVDRLKPSDKLYKVWDTELKGFFVRVSPTGRKTFAARYINSEGLDKTVTIGVYGAMTTEEARKQAKMVIGNASQGIDFQAQKKERRAQAELSKSQTLKGFIDNHYRDYCLSNFRSGPKRVKELESYFGEWFELSLLDINEWRLVKWRNERLKLGIKPSAVNRPVSALKALMNRAVDWGVIDKNPLIKLKPIKEDKRGVIRYLTDQEEKRLMNALQQRQARQRDERSRYNLWRIERRLAPYPDIKNDEFTDFLMPMVILALNTGMRRGELFGLEWSDIDFKAKTIAIHGEKAKSKTTRIIPMNNHSLSILQNWKKQTAGKTLVFPSPKTGLRLDNIDTSWKSLLETANISNFRFHDLRHSFASKLVMKGVDLNTVRELLGHSDISMTMRYAHLAPEHKAAAVAVLN